MFIYIYRHRERDINPILASKTLKSFISSKICLQKIYSKKLILNRRSTSLKLTNNEKGFDLPCSQSYIHIVCVCRLKLGSRLRALQTLFVTCFHFVDDEGKEYSYNGTKLYLGKTLKPDRKEELLHLHLDITLSRETMLKIETAGSLSAPKYWQRTWETKDESLRIVCEPHKR